MKKIILICLFVFLTGCAVPVAQKFPTVPDRLQQTCSPLQLINNDTITLSDFTKTVSENYSLYHECSIKNDAWIEWYKTQKEIFDSIQ